MSADGTSINRGVCADCLWSYAHEDLDFVRARAESHRHVERHTVELRTDIIGILVDTLTPRARMEIVR